MTEILYSAVAIENIVAAHMDKEFGGTWSVSFKAVLDTAPAISENDDITVEGETFFVVEKDETREGEQRYLNIKALHNIFKLEQSIINENYTEEGNIIAHIEKLLTYQEGTAFTVAVDPDVEGQELTDFLATEAILDIKVGEVFKKIKQVLQNFGATYRPAGTVLYVMPKDHVYSSDLSFEYSVNNRDVKRTYDMDYVAKKLVAQAWLRGEIINGVVDPIVVKEYGTGIPVRFKDFGSLTSESALDQLANQFLSMRDTPDAEYQMTVVDLLRLDEGDRPEGISETEIDVGLGCQVVDAGLGIDETLIITRYVKNLVEPHEPARVNLGTIREVYLKRFEDEVASVVETRQERQPRLYSSTDPEHEPDAEKGKDGDVFVRPVS